MNALKQQSFTIHGTMCVYVINVVLVHNDIKVPRTLQIAVRTGEGKSVARCELASEAQSGFVAQVISITVKSGCITNMLFWLHLQ